MSMQCYFIFVVEAFHFIFSNCHTDNKATPFKELVIKLGEGMGVSDSIEPVGVKEGICRNEVVMVYLQEDYLLSHMERTVKQDETVSMQFFKTWKENVTVNGMGFEISEETIARAQDFSMEGKKW